VTVLVLVVLVARTYWIGSYFCSSHVRCTILIASWMYVDCVPDKLVESAEHNWHGASTTQRRNENQLFTKICNKYIIKLLLKQFILVSVLRCAYTMPNVFSAFNKVIFGQSLVEYESILYLRRANVTVV
jgi:hypothetical protein